MKLEKLTIHGKKGKTVCYSLPNFRFDDRDNKLKWDAFRFYTPVGKIADQEGRRFFNVMGAEVLIRRNHSRDSKLILKITRERGLEVLEFPDSARTAAAGDGAASFTGHADLEGDIVATAFIPANPGKEIVIHYKEVTHD
ncbi:MAG: hypothetical protein GY950_21655 [bacterium]|nr:hypothetical protein [bacterium]